MKKFLTIAVIAMTLIVFTACGGSKKKDKDTTDTGDDTDVVDTTDTADPTNPTDPTDSTDPTDPTDTPSGCTGISVDWTTFSQYQYSNQFVASNDDSDPIVLISFFQDEEGSISEGTYDLAAGLNANYKDCTECVLVYSGYDEEEGYSKIYYQQSGTLKIDAVDDSSNIKGSISAVLVEVTIDEEDYTSTPVEGGTCVEIETASFDSGYEEPCVPQCDGKECGSDGCGGACGTCEGQACSAEFKCVPFNCDKLEVEEFEIATVESWFSSYNRYEAYVKDNKLGSAEIPDLLTMTFYTYDAEEDEWSYKTELLEGTETLASYEDDETAIIMYEDYDVENESVGKYYVHESGKLNITKVKEGTLESQGNGSFRVMEVDTDLIQVPGGKCYEFKDITWDTICVPKCEGKVCGDDGCGGTCGDGCGKDKACSADQKSCVAWNCTEITLGEGTYDDWYGSYDMSYTPNTQDDDIVSLALYSYENETYDLYDTDINDSDLFFIVYEGYDEEEGYSKLYFQQKGTVKITTEENEEAIKVKAEISGLRLEEVKSNTRYNKLIPVPGGACYEVKDTTITYTIEEEEYDYDYGD